MRRAASERLPNGCLAVFSSSEVSSSHDGGDKVRIRCEEFGLKLACDNAASDDSDAGTDGLGFGSGGPGVLSAPCFRGDDFRLFTAPGCASVPCAKCALRGMRG